MGFLKELFAGGAGDLINSVGNLVDNVVTTKEEKMHLELEMKKAENQFQADMKKLSNEEKQMYFADTDSARQMASQVQTSPTASKLAKNTAPVLALGTTILTFTLFAFILFAGNKLVHDSTIKDIIIYILGVLSAILTQIFSFYFGSSQGSADKSRILENLSTKLQENKG